MCGTLQAMNFSVTVVQLVRARFRIGVVGSSPTRHHLTKEAMMKVYLVITNLGCCEGEQFRAAFSTLKKAEEYIKIRDDWADEIHTVEVDEHEAK